MTDSENQDDKRGHPRFSISSPFQATVGGTVVAGTIRDISASGASLQMGLSLEVGQTVEIDAGDEAALSGQVARTFSGGAAVQFYQAQDSGVSQFLDSLGIEKSQSAIENLKKLFNP